MAPSRTVRFENPQKQPKNGLFLTFRVTWIQPPPNFVFFTTLSYFYLQLCLQFVKNRPTIRKNISNRSRNGIDDTALTDNILRMATPHTSRIRTGRTLAGIVGTTVWRRRTVLTTAIYRRMPGQPTITYIVTISKEPWERKWNWDITEYYCRYTFTQISGSDRSFRTAEMNSLIAVGKAFRARKKKVLP